MVRGPNPRSGKRQALREPLVFGQCVRTTIRYKRGIQRPYLTSKKVMC